MVVPFFSTVFDSCLPWNFATGRCIDSLAINENDDLFDYCQVFKPYFKVLRSRTQTDLTHIACGNAYRNGFFQSTDSQCICDVHTKKARGERKIGTKKFIMHNDRRAEYELKPRTNKPSSALRHWMRCSIRAFSYFHVASFVLIFVA